jgi:hypothetical protein
MSGGATKAWGWGRRSTFDGIVRRQGRAVLGRDGGGIHLAGLHRGVAAAVERGLQERRALQRLFVLIEGALGGRHRARPGDGGVLV